MAKGKKKTKGDYDWNGEEDNGARRNIALKEDLVANELQKQGLSEEGTIVERALRLESFFRKQQEDAGAPIEDLLRCHPSRPEGGGLPPEAAPGCLYSSPKELAACPFCGMTDVEETPAPVLAESPKADDKPAEVRTNAAEVKAKREKRKKEKASASAPEIVESKDGAEQPSNVASMRREPANDAPGEALAKKPPSPDDLADEEALDAPGGTLEELDALVKAAKDAKDLRDRIDAETFWDEGDALRTIHDKKLWTLVRREGDGGRAYPTFEHFAAEVFGYSKSHSLSLIKISRVLTREQAKTVGVYQAKTVMIGYSNMFELFGEEVADAQRTRLLSAAPNKTGRELEDEVRRMKNAGVILSNEVLKAPEDMRAEMLAAIARADAEYLENEAKRITTPKLPEREPPAPRVPHDDDGVVIDTDDEDDEPPPSSRRPAPAPAPEPKTVSLSLGDTSFEVPLYVNGSSTKPAKKIEDGAHGSLATLTGHSIKFEIRIGDGGQLHVDVKIARPR